MINIKLYEKLKVKLGQEETEDLLLYIEKKAEDQRLIIASKEDLAMETKQIEAKLEQTKLDLELKIEQTKTELLKWFIGAFTTIIIMILGLYIKR